MNVRIVLHLMATYWRQHRWLITAYGVLFVVCAAVPFTFSPGDFQIPFAKTYLVHDVVTKWLEINWGDPLPDGARILIHLGRLFSLAGLLLAAALGFHMRGCTAGRPVQRAAAIAATVSNLLILLVIPILVVAALVPLSLGLGVRAALVSVTDSAGALIPRYTAVVMLGMICGGWWRSAAAILAVAIVSIVFTLFLDRLIFPDWVSSPLGVSLSPPTTAAMWLPVAILAVLIPATLDRVRTVYRIALAAMAVGGAPALLPKSRPQLAEEALADWSGRVELTLENQTLRGKLDGMRSYGKGTMSMPLDWVSKGTPPGIFVDWTRSGSAELRSKGQSISTTLGPSPHLPLDDAAIETAFTSSSQESIEIKQSMTELFASVEPGTHDKASLGIELLGTAYRMERILDVPIGETVKHSIDGAEVRTRPLNLGDGTTLVELCMVMPLKRGTFREYQSPLDSWQPFILFRGGYHSKAEKLFESRAWISPGCLAVRVLLGEERRVARNLRPAAYHSVRLVVLKRKNLGQIRQAYRSAELPFKAIIPPGGLDDQGSRWDPSYSRILPPRPASGASGWPIDAWLKAVASMNARVDWRARAMAPHVAGHLYLFLYGSSISNRTPEASALVIACPESRKQMIIAALPPTDRPNYTNWVSEVILERGWTEEAAPKVLGLVKQAGLDSDPSRQLLVAALEDPSTYQALADGAAKMSTYEVYARVRNVPGIEPALSEAILRQYRTIKPARFDPPNEQDSNLREYRPPLPGAFPHCLIPAAHGIPEAFADLLSAWQGFKRPLKSARLYELREVMQLPEGDIVAVNAALRGKTAADFRYDPLARLWIPVKSAE